MDFFPCVDMRNLPLKFIKSAFESPSRKVINNSYYEKKISAVLLE